MANVALANEAQIRDVDLLGVDQLAQNVLALLKYGLDVLGTGGRGFVGTPAGAGSAPAAAVLLLHSVNHLPSGPI